MDSYYALKVRCWLIGNFKVMLENLKQLMYRNHQIEMECYDTIIPCFYETHLEYGSWLASSIIRTLKHNPSTFAYSTILPLSYCIVR